VSAAKKKGFQATTERRRVTNDPFNSGGNAPELRLKREAKKKKKAPRRNQQKHEKNG